MQIIWISTRVGTHRRHRRCLVREAHFFGHHNGWWIYPAPPRGTSRARARGRTVKVLDVGAGPGGAQGVGEVLVREGAGEVEGGVAAEVLGVDVDTTAEEEVHDGRLGTLRRAWWVERGEGITAGLRWGARTCTARMSREFPYSSIP